MHPQMLGAVLLAAAIFLIGLIVYEVVDNYRR